MTRTILPLLAILALGACTVGPNYVGPPQPAPLAASSPTFHRAAAAQVATSEPPAARWWTALNDPELDRLVDAALAQSPTLRAAEARLRQSRAMLRSSKANLAPNVSGNVAYVRNNLLSSVLGATNSGSSGGSGGSSSGDTTPDASNLYTLGFDATWELDLFGGRKRAVQSAAAQADSVEATLEDARVSLAAEVAQAYVSLRDQQARQTLARQSTDLEGRTLQLAQQRRGQGVASDLDIERLRTQLENTRAGLIPIQAQITDELDRLAVLTGREPGTLDAELTPAAPLPMPPAAVPVGDPADFLRRRPDIRAAERTLAARTATIGQKTADLFPKVNLLGFVGWSTNDLGDIGQVFTHAPTYLVAPTLQWNFLNFGRVRASIHQAEAGRDEALAQYESTVLGALQDAESALSRFGRARDSVVSAARVQASAERSYALMTQRANAGVATTIDLLDAERQRVSAAETLAAANAQMTQAYVSLQKSLGLGWAPVETTPAA